LDRVEGCIVDANGDPWTWGGTVVATQDVTNVPVGSGELDANGCFSVFIGNGLRVTATIDPAPGPAGDPGPLYCYVPTDTSYLPYPWDCGFIDTGTGPNAITLSSLGAAPSTYGLALAGLALALAAVVVLVWRRSQPAT
jgi:hypothetical protein